MMGYWRMGHVGACVTMPTRICHYYVQGGAWVTNPQNVDLSVTLSVDGFVGLAWHSFGSFDFRSRLM